MAYTLSRLNTEFKQLNPIGFKRILYPFFYDQTPIRLLFVPKT